MIRRVMFPAPQGDSHPEIFQEEGRAYLKVTKAIVQRALDHQSTKKAPGPDKLNFLAIRLLWKWDAERVVCLIRQSIKMGYHPYAWRTVKGILLRKPNKLDYTQVKSYRIISLLNCLGKVAEKVVAELIAEWCELSGSLHQGQMGCRKQRSCIDAVARVMTKTEKAWEKRNIAALLLMDVKGAFDHVNCERLKSRMQGMGLDKNLTMWVGSFLTDRRLQLVIDGHCSTERQITSGIPQGSPVSPILFAIYLSGIFKAVEEAIPGCQATSFADDCGFLVEAPNVKDLAKLVEETGNKAIEWGEDKGLQFDNAKTEVLALTRRRKQMPQISQMEMVIKSHTIKFNKEATRWLGIWLDSALKFRAHKDVYLQKARKAEARLRGIVSKKGLASGLVRKIQIAAVQSVSLYGAELWWRDQKTWAQEYQNLICRQGRTITGMFKSAPIGVVVKEAGLRSAASLLDNRQRRYALRVLSLPKDNTLREILPVTFRDGDVHAQPGEIESGDWDWQTDLKTKRLGQRLANSLAKGTKIDTSYGCEYTQIVQLTKFPGEVEIADSREKAKDISMSHRVIENEMTYWTDGSKLENQRAGAGITWIKGNGKWESRKVYLGKNKEIFDAELYAIDQALDIALRGGRGRGRLTSPKMREILERTTNVHICTDSKAAIGRITHLRPGPGQWLACRIHRRAQELKDYEIGIHILWVPGHTDIEGNERADRAAKDAAKTGMYVRERFNSLSHTSRLITECKWNQDREWFRAQHQKRKPESRSTYKLLDKKQTMDKIAAGARKGLASIFYQLKSGHAHTADYLFKIGKSSSRSCIHCQNAGTQTVRHLMMDCRKWRRERDNMWAKMKKEGCTLRHNWSKIRYIFADEKATAAVLRYLLCTNIGRKSNEEEVEERERNRLLDIGIADLDEYEDLAG